MRALQKLGGRSKEDCAEYMFRGLTAPEHKGGFWLVDQYGLWFVGRQDERRPSIHLFLGLSLLTGQM